MTIASTDVRLDLRKLTANIGAEVSGLDLTQPLTPAQVQAVEQALVTHKALVFRGQHVDNDQQRAFAALFGPLTKAHPTVGSLPGAPEILWVDSERSVANNWHTDVTFVVNPPKASTLSARVLPEYGGETLIANTAAAYRGLPEPLRRFADTLWAVHTNDYDYAVAPEDVEERVKEYRKEFVSTKFETAHPVVRVHPVTKERGLFVGGFAQRIVGLSKTESRDILRLLQAYVTKPEQIVRVTWEPGQLVLFDNRITQHYAPDNYDRLPRTLHRVTIGGDVPVGVDGGRSQGLQGDSSAYSPLP